MLIAAHLLVATAAALLGTGRSVVPVQGPATVAASPITGRPTLARRALLSLPLLLALPVQQARAADKFDFVDNGVTRQMTEIEARDALTKKVEAATAAGKGLDLERRGQYNEKARARLGASSPVHGSARPPPAALG